MRNGAYGPGRQLRASRPRSGERKTAHRADAHFAGDAVAGNLAGKRQRQRHRVGDRDFPGDVVAAGGPKCGDQARAAARIRFVIRMRNATYWIAKAASLAPTRTTVT